MSPKNTPPTSPGIPHGNEEDEDPDHLYADEVDEEIDVLEGQADGDMDDVDDEEDELEELPGGLDQLEEILSRRNDDSVQIFKGHAKSVFCCAYHPVEGVDLVVSGGEDDLAYIWNSKTGEPVEKLDLGWKDSVHCTAWSQDGNLLAMADMSGLIKVVRYPGFSEVWSFEVGDILWMTWHKQAHVLFCGTADSEMWMWKVPSGDSKLFQGQGEKTECGALMPVGTKAVCGYTDGSIRIFNLKQGSAIHTITSQGLGHLDAVNCVACHPNGNIIMSGSMDGTAKLWSTNNARLIGTLMIGEKQEQNSPSSVECCDFPSDKTSNLCVTGSLDGVVTIWDTSSQISRASIKIGEGVTRLQVHPSRPVILAATLDGVVRCLDLMSGDSIAEFGGHKSNILDLSLSPCGGRMVTASDDGTCRIFQQNNN